MKRRVAIALVLLVAALVVWRLARLSEPLPGAPVLSPSSSATESERDEPLQIPSDVDASLPDADSRVVAARERSETRAASRVAPRFVADARLAVRAVAEGSGEPLGGVVLRLEPWLAGASERAAARARGEFWRAEASTDVDGLAEFDAPSGRALRVEAESAHTLPAMLDVEPLAAGARSEVEVRIAPLGDFVLHGVLLDAETRRSLPFGVLEIASPGESAARLVLSSSGRPMSQVPSVRAGADGRFSMRGTTGRPANVRATAKGYAPTVFSLERRLADRAEPFEVLLWRGATLDVEVVDAAFAPIAGATVRAAEPQTGMPRDALVFGVLPGSPGGVSSLTDERGHALLEELAPRTPLGLSIQAAGFPTSAHPESVELAPGERRSVTVRIGRGAAIVGRVIDEHGKALSGVVVRLGARMDLDPSLRLLDPTTASTESTESDGAGEFRLDGVPTGTWFVQAVAGYEPRHAPVAQAVRILPEDTEVEVVLRLTPGLFLSGVVVDADGRPQPGCTIEAARVDGPEVSGSQSGSDGRFGIGPLPAGTWRIRVRGSSQSDATLSEVITAEAGRSDLVLELLHGGSISGSVADADFRTAYTSVVTLSRRGSGLLFETSATPAFTFRGLEPGTYVVRAHDFTGRTEASVAIRLEREERREGVRLVPRTAGRLRVWNGRAGPARVFDVLAEGEWIDTRQASESIPTELVLPLGDYTVEWETGGERRSKSVRVAAERPAEVELEGEP